ncbi:MAG: hypothetical protein KF837_13130 [Labilithrix sp.]|nr:hypothetical protein [Labilithrix sp.]
MLKVLAEMQRTLADLATKVDAVATDVKAHRAETKKGFEALDKELAVHSERTHRKIEERLDKLEAIPKTKPARASVRTPRRR